MTLYTTHMKGNEFSDYDGPTGLYVATGSAILPLGSAEGIAAVAQSAMLTSLGAGPAAKKFQVAMQQSLVVAHELDRASAAIAA